MYNQTGNIADYIFPLVRANKKQNGHYEYLELVGTAFLIGQDGFALTAAHVIEQCFDNREERGVVLGLFWANEGWHVEEISIYEKHPVHDVGLIKLNEGNWKSFLELDANLQNSSCEYHCWGYPHETAKEVQQLYQNVIERPDLIFSQGYVRRRISRELYPTIIFRGNQFYELSEQVGGGNSGAPIILKTSIGGNRWKFFGIYIGEKSGSNVSYAVRAESFYDWKPEILNKTIIDESLNGA